MRMDDLEQFIDGNHLRGVSYRTDKPQEIVHPRIVRRDGVTLIYLHNLRHLSHGGHVPVTVFLEELARGVPGLTATGYRANKKHTTLTFDKKDRVKLSPALQAYLSREVVKPHLDAEAKHFKVRFLDGGNSQLDTWLPQYRQTLAIVRDALSRRKIAEIIDLVWMMQDNSISNAGQGTMGKKVVDRVRPNLIDVTERIAADGSPENFARLTTLFEGWFKSKLVPKVPRLVLARAFAAIHPDRYHTIVDSDKQDKAIEWFVRHTGFVRMGGNWADQAAALSAHLRYCNVSGQQEVRNVFPWFVYCNLAADSGRVRFIPGHKSRVPTGTAQAKESIRTVQYRQNIIQDRLVEILRRSYGDSVASEHPTGTGGTADTLVFNKDGQYLLYEIKPAETASDAVRQAMGQLLEYSYRRNGLNASALVVVSNAALDVVTEEYLGRLNAQFQIPIEYMHVPDD